MTRKIFQSIILTAGVVLLASLLIIMSCLYDYFAGVQEKQLRDELSLAAAAVESEGTDYLSRLGSESYRLTWVAADGSVLFDTKTYSAAMENHAEREEIRRALESGEGEVVRYSDTLLEKTVYCARRLSDGTVLRVSVSRASVGMLLIGMLQPAALVCLAALILSFLLASRISKRIAAPLNRLDLENPLENDTYEELAPLLTRIDQQRRQIDSQLAELRRKNDEFDQITSCMTEGLVLLNEKGAVVSINPAARRLFNADAGCVGQDFLTVERNLDVNRAIRLAAEKGHGEARLERAGREYQLDVSRIEADGKPAGAVILAFDATEQAQAEQSRREFTANVSHELKTPLQSIMGSAELIENGLVRQEDLPRFAGRIRTESARLVALIEDIIRLSRLDEGGELPQEPVDLGEVARETAASLQEAAQQRGVTLEVRAEDVPVTGMRRLFHEIAYNLCENAIKYNKPGGSVTVTAKRSGSRAVLTVEDTGIGIPLIDQVHVFERFFRVDKSHSRETGGTGLGLSIVKHAVQRMDGQIALESRPGEGTRIEVVFPLRGE